MKKRFTETQITGFLKEAQSGCRSRSVAVEHEPLELPSAPNPVWSMDFAMHW